MRDYARCYRRVISDAAAMLSDMPRVMRALRDVATRAL